MQNSRYLLRFVLCEKFRKLVCQYLSTLLCVRCGYFSTGGASNQYDVEIAAIEMDLPPIYTGNRRSNGPSAPPLQSATESGAIGQVLSAIEHLLASIRDLLEISARTSSRQRHQEEKNQKMMNDWMVAAAVIDRICFILIALFVSAGTVVFVVLRYIPHHLF